MEQFFIDCKTVTDYLRRQQIDPATLKNLLKKLCESYQQINQTMSSSERAQVKKCMELLNEQTNRHCIDNPCNLDPKC